MKHLKLILLVFLIVSCQPPKKPSNIVAKGDVAKISLIKDNIYQGELITVRDSNIYIINQNKIMSISFADIKNIEIPGYSVDAGQRIGAALPSLLMQGFILMIASDIDEQGWVTITGISMAATVLLYATAGSEIEFSAPISEDDLEQVRLYCRYPQELDDTVWHNILSTFNYGIKN